MATRLAARKRATPEEDLCLALAQFLLLALPAEAGVWFSHIGHGGQRSKAQSGRFKAMGLRPGMADYIFLWHDHVPRVAFLEIKVGKNKRSPEQEAFLEHCQACEIDCGLARSLVEAEHFLRLCGVPLRYTIDPVSGAWKRRP